MNGNWPQAGEQTMQRNDLRHFKRMLEGMLDGLQSIPRPLDEIAVQTVADFLDQGQHLVDHDVAIQRLEYGCRRARDIRAALQRLEEGTYGVCVECDSAITLKRINAVPWTPYCLECQDTVDRHHNQPGEYVLGEVAG